MSRRGGRWASLSLLVGWLTGGCDPVPADLDGTVAVAVAANFVDAHAALAARFEEVSGYRVVASGGSTGQLYAQVINGAPFDVLLSADAERPRLLEERGLGVEGTRFTYAVGRLVLYGPGLDSVRTGGPDLANGEYRNLAIANPAIAPYGAAAHEVLDRLGTRDAVGSRIVQGESVTQAFQFLRSGGAELGFVALAQVIEEPPTRYWIVPAGLHEPIRQDAILLRRGEGKDAAHAYLAFLGSPEARGLIVSFGYDVEGAGSE